MGNAITVLTLFASDQKNAATNSHLAKPAIERTAEKALQA
jgi:hypothetical protein